MTLIRLYLLFIILILTLSSCNKSRVIDFAKRKEILYNLDGKPRDSASYYVASVRQKTNLEGYWLIEILLSSDDKYDDEMTIYLINKIKDDTFSMIFRGSSQIAKSVGRIECMDSDCHSRKANVKLSDIYSGFKTSPKNEINLFSIQNKEKYKLTILDQNSRELESYNNLSFFIHADQVGESTPLIVRNEFVGNHPYISNYKFNALKDSFYPLFNEGYNFLFLYSISFNSIIVDDDTDLEMIPCVPELKLEPESRCGQFSARDIQTFQRQVYQLQFSKETAVP